MLYKQLPLGEIHDLVERYAPDRLRGTGDPFLVIHKGHTYSITYSPAFYSGKGAWVIWEPEVLTLPEEAPSFAERYGAGEDGALATHTIECVLCGFGTVTTGLPRGWQSRGGKGYCPSCIDRNRE